MARHEETKRRAVAELEARCAARESAARELGLFHGAHIFLVLLAEERNPRGP